MRSILTRSFMRARYPAKTPPSTVLRSVDAASDFRAGRQAVRGQPLETPDEERSIDDEPEREPDPDAGRAITEDESEAIGRCKANQPEAHARVEERHARVVEAAKRAERHGLQAVEHEEARTQAEQERSERHRLGMRRRFIQEKMRDRPARERDRDRH